MTGRSKVDDLYAELGELDRDILGQVERRARVVREILKQRGDALRAAPVLDARRLKALEESVSAPLDASSVRALFETLDVACRMFEVAPRVACTGGEGGFGQLAGIRHFGTGAEFVRADTPEKALEEISRGRADFAILPYESLKEGLVFSTILAIAAADLRLVGEREIVQSLDLINRTGNPGDVETVHVAPLHHALSDTFLNTNFSKATVLDVRSAHMAAELAVDHHGAAAIVPHGLSLRKELVTVKANIADEGEARVRYGIVARLPMPRTGNDATALLFSVHDKPGALHDVLENFKERACNLRRIQSRAVPGEGWEYVFYVEVGGHVTDRPLVAALEGVKKKARMMKIVGSFPLDLETPPPSAETR
jgi:chorismate mutase / prephenate dehydratase